MEEAGRRGTSRSGPQDGLLATEQAREQVLRYLDRYGWDIAEDDATWREDQRRRTAEDCGDDEG